MRAALFLAALLWPAALPAQGAPKAYEPSAEYQQCMRQGDAARGNATAVDVCLGLEQTVQLERMGEAYDRAFGALTGWDQVRLYNDQTEWREGLDARCAEVARRDPANQADARAFNICRTTEIAARADWLDRYSAE